MPHALTEQAAVRFVDVALGHVTREYPNKLSHCLSGPRDARTPRALHPLFYGSFDWHSCVHSYWMLARLLRLFPAMARAADIRALFDRQIVDEKVAGECAYLRHPTARGFERPYGWAWLLKLAAALMQLTQQAPPSSVVIPGLLDGMESVNRLAQKWLSRGRRPRFGRRALGTA